MIRIFQYSRHIFFSVSLYFTRKIHPVEVSILLSLQPICMAEYGTLLLYSGGIGFVLKRVKLYTLKHFSEIFRKVVGQLKIQMGRKFFPRYSRQYFQHRTGNRFYFLIRKISSLLGKIDIFHNLSGRRFLKSEQISVFVE